MERELDSMERERQNLKGVILKQRNNAPNRHQKVTNKNSVAHVSYFFWSSCQLGPT